MFVILGDSFVASTDSFGRYVDLLSSFVPSIVPYYT
jgi:hypothetical protein